jgi:hypothetical protein
MQATKKRTCSVVIPYMTIEIQQPIIMAPKEHSQMQPVWSLTNGDLPKVSWLTAIAPLCPYRGEECQQEGIAVGLVVLYDVTEPTPIRLDTP